MSEKLSPILSLSDGTEIPQLGFGTYKSEGQDAYNSVRHALEVGYRHIDTAALYGNEKEVGHAINDAIAQGVCEREEIFLTTKLWNDRHGVAEAPRAFQESLKRLGQDYIDCYLIHWPCPGKNLYVETYRALTHLMGLGTVRTVGVSNFYGGLLAELVEATGITPTMNQVELHPGFSQATVREEDSRLGIVTESWSPLGRGRNFDHTVLHRIAEETNKTVAQVILRWHLQLGLVVIPKSIHDDRIEENFNVFDFELTEQQMEAITSLDTDSMIAGRFGPDPKEFGNDM